MGRNRQLNKRTHAALIAIMAVVGFALYRCGGQPASQTHTVSETTTRADDGTRTTREVQETRTQADDGTRTVNRTETTEQVTPPPAPSPPPPN